MTLYDVFSACWFYRFGLRGNGAYQAWRNFWLGVRITLSSRRVFIDKIGRQCAVVK